MSQSLTVAKATPQPNPGRFARALEILKQFRSNPTAFAGLIIVTIILIVAIFGPFFVPYPKDASGAVHISSRLLPPSAEHWMGTDHVGRDILTRLVIGARTSLLAGTIVIALAVTLGTLLGAVAGFAGGWVETVIMRITDVFLTIPDLILAMAFAAALGPGLLNVMIAVSLVWWPGYARLVRANVISLRNAQFAEAADSLGASRARVLFAHILPNAFPSILVKASIDIGFAILTTASLSFIGLGTQPPTPDWGAMVSEGRGYLRESWWYPTFPGLAILLTVIAMNLMGDGLRDILDPRRRKR